MPSAEQIKQWLSTVAVPILAGVLATWITVHIHFLALFHVTTGSVAAIVSQLGVFGVTAALGFLTSHHILSGHYTPAAKAANANIGVPVVNLNQPPK